MYFMFQLFLISWHRHRQSYHARNGASYRCKYAQ